MATVLVTGAAGFIGYHVSQLLLDRGDVVIGLDNLNSYYDPALKQARLAQLAGQTDFHFVEAALEDRPQLEALFCERRPDRVVHLAAQAGVRYSLENPHAYVDSNLVGFVNVLEACRSHRIEHLVYASSSSVYGSNTKIPFSESDPVDHPISLYAATKRSGELLAHTYSHLFALPTTGLRFFTVYGPWGRPDMALFLFTKAILEDRPIDLFDQGRGQRDFTYIDDIAEGVLRVLDRVPVGNMGEGESAWNAAQGQAPFRLYNIGRGEPVPLESFIQVLEECLGRRAKRRLLPPQPGDVPITFADTSALERDVGYRPRVSIEEGVRRFVAWYREHYRIAS